MNSSLLQSRGPGDSPAAKPSTRQALVPLAVDNLSDPPAPAPPEPKLDWLNRYLEGFLREQLEEEDVVGLMDGWCEPEVQQAVHLLVEANCDGLREAQEALKVHSEVCGLQQQAMEEGEKELKRLEKKLAGCKQAKKTAIEQLAVEMGELRGQVSAAETMAIEVSAHGQGLQDQLVAAREAYRVVAAAAVQACAVTARALSEEPRVDWTAEIVSSLAKPEEEDEEVELRSRVKDERAGLPEGLPELVEVVEGAERAGKLMEVVEGAVEVPSTLASNQIRLKQVGRVFAGPLIFGWLAILVAFGLLHGIRASGGELF